MEPETEGIKYAGSKLKILPYILDEIIALPDVHSILDGFAGTTRVTQALYKSGYDVFTNDLSPWSEVFNRCYLLADKPLHYYQKMIDHLNALKGKEGWFTAHYGGINNQERKYPFQLKNTLKLDAIREEIDLMGLDEIDKSVLLTSLVLALDHVDNTIGHYVSYLAKWSQRSYRDLYLRMPLLPDREEIINKYGWLPNVRIFKDDVFNVLDKAPVDLAYFDPPYGSNNEKMPPSRVRYASYYHIWKTVILNDKPETFGNCCRREDSRDTIAISPFEEYRISDNGKHIAMEAVERLVRDTQSHYILISYSSGGITTKSELLDILHSNGNLLKIIEIDYKKHVMASMKWTNEWASKETKNTEYLFLLEK